MNANNLAIILAVILANLASFFWGGYYALSPFLFLAGLVATSIVSVWTANGMKTKDLVILVVMTILVATVDEYAHTSAGTLTYYDHAVPSPLTVFGWSLFIILILTMTRFLGEIPLLAKLGNSKVSRIIPAVVSLVLIPIMVLLQGYAGFFSIVLVLVCVMLSLTSLYYTYWHSLKWNLSLMVSSLVFGIYMEFTGALEGLWTFPFNEPISLFIVFTWPLRIWTINAFCLLFNVDFSETFRAQGKS